MTNSKYYTEEFIINSHPKIRANFIQKTYLNLAFCIFSFFGILVFLVQTKVFNWLLDLIFKINYGIYFLFIIFILITVLLNFWIKKFDSLILQYLILIFYIILKSIVFLPVLVLLLNQYSDFIFYAISLILGLFSTIFIISLNKNTDFPFFKSFIYLILIIGFIAFILWFFLDFQNLLFLSIPITFLIGFFILILTSKLIIYKYRNNQVTAATLTLFSGWIMVFLYGIIFIIKKLQKKI